MKEPSATLWVKNNARELENYDLKTVYKTTQELKLQLEALIGPHDRLFSTITGDLGDVFWQFHSFCTKLDEVIKQQENKEKTKTEAEAFLNEFLSDQTNKKAAE